MQRVPQWQAVVVWKKMVPKGDGTIRGCGFVGVGVSLLEEACHCGGGLKWLLCSSYTECGHNSIHVACGSR